MEGGESRRGRKGEGGGGGGRGGGKWREGGFPSQMIHHGEDSVFPS